jgi:16S rRNA (guanine966-N2)-methyltransferase
MRIISGTYKGRRLKTVPGLEVRPTSDRLRETLFNILTPHIRGSRFLDLCAGSGAIGIEAASRGAIEIVFVDKSRQSCAVLQENLTMIGGLDNARIIQRDALVVIKQLENALHRQVEDQENISSETSGKFDIVYLDPPYDSGIYTDILKQLATSQLIDEDSIVVVEHRTWTRLEPTYGDLKVYRELKQGTSSLTFFQKVSEQEPAET